MLAVAVLGGIPLAIATVIGLIVSFFQAITQIQDQTLSQTIKIASIALSLLVIASFLTGPLMSTTREVFSNFAQIVR